jgi:tRNA-Thr(GGU) m(6)t(6)A37 methyltransferase TsaA
MTDTPAPSQPPTPRPGEITIELPATSDAQLYFIGHIRTPFATLADCPKNTREGAHAVATIEIDPRYAAGLEGLERFSHLILLYWMDGSRRDLLRQTPRHLDAPRGTFALRSPLRPNPISLAVVELLRVDGTHLTVRGIDCRSGTPLLDVKPYFASTDSVPDARRG